MLSHPARRGLVRLSDLRKFEHEQSNDRARRHKQQWNKWCSSQPGGSDKYAVVVIEFNIARTRLVSREYKPESTSMVYRQ
jgi:hypothetical protein